MPTFPLAQAQNNQNPQFAGGSDDEKELFTQQFAQLADRAFRKTLPEMMQNVITFRVLDVDVDSGTGIGTFILQYANDIVFVPCVVADNAIKPLDMFYSRTADKFFPLSNNWLREATKDDVSELGGPTQAPKSMPTDVDIRNIAIPPTTGRYSYASDEEGSAELPFKAAQRAAELRPQTAELHFPRLLKEASDSFKRAFQRTLTLSPKLASLYGNFYGVKAMTAALATENASEKTSALRVEIPMKRDVFLMTASTPIQEAQKALEPGELARGYSIARTYGFYVKDKRKSLNDIVSFSESDIGLTEPERSGIYDVYMASGKMERVLVISNPKKLQPQRSDDVGAYRHDYTRRNTPEAAGVEKNYLVLFQDGRYTEKKRLLASPVIEAMQKDVTRFIEEMTSAAPKPNSYGCFVSAGHYDVLGYRLVTVDSVANIDSNVTLIQGDMTIRLDKRMPKGAVIKPQDQSTMMMSASYRWFAAKDRVPEAQVLSDSRHITAVIELDLRKRGGNEVEIKTAGEGRFIVGNDGEKLTALQAVEKAAVLYHLPIAKVAQVIGLIGAGAPIHVWTKTAAGESLDPNGAPTPEEMAPQGPPPPSGIDLATGEKMQQIQGQIAALQQMLQMLGEVQQRAQLIDQGGGATAAPAAAASMAAGPGMLQGQAPMVPFAGGQPPQGAAPQGGQPPQGGAVTPIGAPQPPQPPPPQPVMPDEAPSPETIRAQINPDFLDSAQQLDDEGIFDAAAIASLAKQKHLNGSIQNYLPALERAMDNLGRLLLLFGMKESEIKQSIGTDAHTETEQHLRDVFKGMGEAILSVKQYMEQLASRPNNPVY